MGWQRVCSPLTPTPLPRGERGFGLSGCNSVPSPLPTKSAYADGVGEGQGEG
jgi:hypothetical protein